jgi:hypothetical protein
MVREANYFLEGLVGLVSQPFLIVRPIWWNQCVPHLSGIFSFVEPVGSVPLANRTRERAPSAERFRSIPLHSRTEHTLIVLLSVNFFS